MWHSIPLTLFWFVYFGSLGIFFPYFALYLRENAALSGAEIGVVLAIAPLIGMVAQPFWGRIADRTGARSRMLAYLTLGTAMGYLGLGAAEGFWPIVAAAVLMAIVGTAIFPLLTSVSLAILRDAGRHAFGHVRVWGTVGYFILVISFPRILQWYRTIAGISAAAPGVSQPGLGVMFPAAAGLVGLAACVAFFLPKRGVVSLRAARGDWRELLQNRPFLGLLFFSLSAQFLMQGSMWLFPLFVRSRGGDLETIRNMWILMLLFEIPLVLLTGSGLKRLGARGLLMVGAAAGGLRWFLSAVARDADFLFAVQALHGVTVVGLNLGSPLYLDAVAPEKLRSTAQSILSMVGAGLAGVTSNLAAGWLIDRAGIDALYVSCGLGLFALGGLSGLFLPSVAYRSEKAAEGALPSDTPA